VRGKKTPSLAPSLFRVPVFGLSGGLRLFLVVPRVKGRRGYGGGRFPGFQPREATRRRPVVEHRHVCVRL
jgi:hypothetical protein